MRRLARQAWAQPFVAAAAAAAATEAAASCSASCGRGAAEVASTSASTSGWWSSSSSRAWASLHAPAHHRRAAAHAPWPPHHSPAELLPFTARALHSPGSMRGFAAASSKRSPKPRATAAQLGMYGAAASVAMIGFAYASVPLYKLFCAATGYGGTVAGAKTVEEKLRRRQEQPDADVEKAAAEREVTVWFNADVADDMPWEFKPTQEYVRVKPGQSTLAFFTASNKSDQPVTGYSVYNVQPDKIGQYFNKIQCFCFEEQRLQPKETVDMPVFFYIDSEMAADWNCRNVDDVTLSYKFHKVDDEDLEDESDAVAPAAPGSGIKLHGTGIGPDGQRVQALLQPVVAPGHTQGPAAAPAQ